MRKLNGKERMERLRAALRADSRQASQSLAARMDRCAVDWKGRYECRSPACLHCRRRHVAREQRVFQSWFSKHENADLAFVTVVLEGTRDVSDLGRVISRSRDATRKRIAACRAKSSKWNGVYLAGWHEIDAVASDQVPLLPPQRRGLIEKMVPWSANCFSPTWIGSYHGIIHLNGLPVEEISYEFRRQWKLDRQVNVVPFDPASAVPINIDRIVSYGNKFSSVVQLKDHFHDPWPLSWQTTYFGWLQGLQRNPFEALRFSVGIAPNNLPATIDQQKNERNITPMPCLFSGLSVYEYTGALRWD